MKVNVKKHTMMYPAIARNLNFFVDNFRII